MWSDGLKCQLKSHLKRLGQLKSCRDRMTIKKPNLLKMAVGQDFKKEMFNPDTYPTSNFVYNFLNFPLMKGYSNVKVIQLHDAVLS